MARWRPRLAACWLAVLISSGAARASIVEWTWGEERWPGSELREALLSSQELPALLDADGRDGSASRVFSFSFETQAVDELFSQEAGHNQKARPPFFAYPSAFGVILLVVLLTYHSKGSHVVLLVMLYIAASCGIKLAVKWMLVGAAFEFPSFVTMLAMAFGGLLCWLAAKIRQTTEPIPVPDLREFATIIMPISVTSGLSIVFGNLGLSRTTVSFAEIVGSTTPISSILLVIVFGMPFHRMLTLPALAVVIGCVLSSAGTVDFSLLGCFYCISSAFLSALKGVIVQKVQAKEEKIRFCPLMLNMWVSLLACFFVLGVSLSTEGLTPLRNIAGRNSAELASFGVGLCMLSLASGALGFAQITLTRDIGTVGQQLLSSSKSVLTVLGGIVVFGDPFGLLEMIGFAGVLVGVYVYQAMDEVYQQQARVQALIDAHKLPANERDEAGTPTKTPSLSSLDIISKALSDADSQAHSSIEDKG